MTRDLTDGTPTETPTDRTATRRWTRRAALGATGAALLAGCIGGGADPEAGDGPTAEEGSPTPTSDEGSEGDVDSPAGAGAPAGIGDVLSGDYLSLMVEYVRPVETVLDFREFPHTDDDAVYGVPRTVDYFVESGFAEAGTSLYGVGLAVKNAGEGFVDVSTLFLRSEAQPIAMEVFMGRSQRLAFGASGRSNSRLLAPGEFARGEAVYALSGDPTDYALTLQPATHPAGLTEQLAVDLGTGAEAEAPFRPSVSPAATGEAVGVGDFEVTVDAATFVESVADSPHQELFGPREGYEYLVVDLSVTRRFDAMIGQDWSVGVRDDDGYGTAWGTVYDDVMDINRPMLDELAVGESSSQTLAFPIEEGFRPAYLTMNVDGPVESEVLTGRQTFRSVWDLA